MLEIGQEIVRNRAIKRRVVELDVPLGSGVAEWDDSRLVCRVILCERRDIRPSLGLVPSACRVAGLHWTNDRSAELRRDSGAERFVAFRRFKVHASPPE